MLYERAENYKTAKVDEKKAKEEEEERFQVWNFIILWDKISYIHPEATSKKA